MHADNRSPITINVRQGTGTYAAKAPGHKATASCTTGARQAAESLAKKLGPFRDIGNGFRSAKSDYVVMSE